MILQGKQKLSLTALIIAILILCLCASAFAISINGVATPITAKPAPAPTPTADSAPQVDTAGRPIPVYEQANMTFSSCMKVATTSRDAGFDNAKATSATCLTTISLTNDSKNGNKICSDAYLQSMLAVQSAYGNAKVSCKQLPHTWWQAFVSYFE